MVKRYCKVEYRDEVGEFVQNSRSWKKFKEKLLEKYQLGDQLLDLADLRKISRRSFGTTKQFLTEYERVVRLVPDLSDKDRCLIFLDNFTEVEQRKLVKGMQERYDWPKIRENLLAENFDQILYRLLKQQKEDRERVHLGADKDKEVYKTLAKMKEMIVDMREERLKFQVLAVKDQIVFTTIRGEVFDFEGNLIDSNIEGGMRKEAFRRMGRPLPATFRLASPEEANLFELEEAMASLEVCDCKEEKLEEKKEDIARRAREVTKRLGKCRDSIVRLCVDMEEVWPNLPNVFLFGGSSSVGQDGSVSANAPTPGATSLVRPMVMSLPLLKRGMPVIMVQTRKGRKTVQSQPAPGESSRGPQEKEPIQMEDEEDEEDEKPRAEDEQQARQRAMEKNLEKGKDEVEIEEPRKKKNVYTIPVEKKIDFEQIVDQILESQRDLVTLKEILVVSPKLREDFKQRMTKKRVMTVELSEIIPPEANWAPPGTKMDWRCVATGHMKVQIGLDEYSALVDDGAEINVMRERHAIEAGVQINRNDCGFLIGVSGASPFCGTASGVMVTVGKVKVQAYFYILPKVKHEVLLGRSFLCRTESLIINKHDGTMFVALNDPVCGYYEVVRCENTRPENSRNRLNPESFTFSESEKMRRERESIEEEGDPQEFSLTLPDISQAIDFVSTHLAIDRLNFQATGSSSVSLGI
ncbi:hypothetical protein CBR_g19545 [Chara braunii]|uniref:Peptidase A2 domain-containing protein n=1 Tax=Chara braunii TaxID=69332 RepID=A0A388KYH9_CHABU|nr:hypothetical protein CBR_g19545 [Chara braunii]|eukprot:GBG75032.1 hypothetical protein CBR_g19545 [Chara braunii]